MTHGIANLRCPRCGQAFLTSAQGPEALIICPHCAQGAPMRAFAAGGLLAPGAAAVPVLRRVLPERPAPLAKAAENAVPAQEPEPESDEPLPEDALDPVVRTRSRHPSMVFMEQAPSEDDAFIQTDPNDPNRFRPRWKAPVAVFLLVAAVAAWMVWKYLQQDPQVLAQQAAEGKERAARPPIQDPAESVSSGTIRIVPPPVTIDIEAAYEAAKAMVPELFLAPDHASRAALVEKAQNHAAEIDGFFARPDLVLHAIKPAPAMPQRLPGLDAVPVFQVFTSLNPNGALLRLVPHGKGQFLIDWPLFHDTHERRLAQFNQPDGGREPVWLDLAFRRNHGFDLSEATRKRYLAFDVQGSANDSLLLLAVAERETALGRFLDRELQWSRIYLGRLLLQSRELSTGHRGVVILDFEGAASAW